LKDCKTTYESIARTLEKAHKVWVTTHLKSDGDAIGSELGFYRALRAMGKDVRIINDTVVPSTLRFLLNEPDEILVYDPERDLPFLNEADTIVVLDVGLTYRLGRMEEIFLNSRAAKICMDHHMDVDAAFDLLLKCPAYNSTGELVYELIRHMSLDLTEEVSTPIYAAICVDSGNFSYERCVGRTFRTAADLVEHGANPYQIHLNLNWRRTLGEVKLEGEAVRRLKLDENPAIAYTWIDLALMAQNRLDPMEIPPLVNIPLSVEGVEIALLFVEMAPGRIKVSARSKGRIKVCDLARQFNGGGHPLAAGFNLNASLDQAVDRVLAAARALLFAAETGTAGPGEAGQVPANG
jgi:bifunctional oligoribonuclease and PAP phosphatase NrnA